MCESTQSKVPESPISISPDLISEIIDVHGFSIGRAFTVVVHLMLSWCCLRSALARILLRSEPKVSDGWLLAIYLLGSSCSTRFSLSSSPLIA
ncbi:hypothetical protein Bca4012_088712 [Brassica carinata]